MIGERPPSLSLLTASDGDTLLLLTPPLLGGDRDRDRERDRVLDLDE
jgi:hypothetical protein